MNQSIEEQSIGVDQIQKKGKEKNEYILMRLFS